MPIANSSDPERFHNSLALSGILQSGFFSMKKPAGS
jgi:hypothetical protein